MPQQQRYLRMLVMAATTLILISVFIAGFAILPDKLASNSGSEPASAGLLPVANTVPQTPSPAVQPGTSGALSPTAEVDDEDLVAIVNGSPVDATMMRTQMLADQAMAHLTGQEMNEAYADTVARLINSELIWLEVQQTVVTVAHEDAQASLTALLESYGKSEQELESALVAAGLPRDEFDAYFARLVTIDGYAAIQAEALGLAPGGYLRTLQSEAQVSFGPLAVPRTVDAAAYATDEYPEGAVPAAVMPETGEADILASETVAAVVADPPRGTAVGQLAPTFDLPLVAASGTDFLSLNALQGKPSILSFWTTWCPYCRKQTPVLADANNHLADRIQFVGVNVKEAESVVDEYVRSNSVPYPVVLDTEGDVAHKYAVNGYPTTFFLDENGRVVARHVGTLTAEQIDVYVNLLIK